MKNLTLLIGILCLNLSIYAQNPQPNIIVVIADDLGWSQVSTGNTNYNNPSDFYETPNIETLANEGISFPNAYAAPTCSPSRSAFLSGQYAPRSTNNLYIQNDLNVTNQTVSLVGPDQGINGTVEIPSSTITIAETLKSAGYTTAHLGKFGVGDPSGSNNNGPLDQGFDYNYGGTSANGPGSYFASNGSFGTDIGPELDAYASNYSSSESSQLAGDNSLTGTPKHVTDALTDAAIDFMDANNQSPFYLQFWQYAVHTPYTNANARPDLLAKYQAKEITNPSQMGQTKVGQAAIAEGMDQSIGRLIDYLETTADPQNPGHMLSENTLVVFFSDNGGTYNSNGGGPLNGFKGSMKEGGIRVASIAWGPSFIGNSGSINETPIHNIDWYPTLSELGGATLPGGGYPIDGESFVPILNGTNSTTTRENVFFHFPGYRVNNNLDERPQTFVRSGVYKLIHYYETASYVMYDVVNDPGENTDVLIGNPSNDILCEAERMSQAMIDWINDVNAPLPTYASNGQEVPLPYLIAGCVGCTAGSSCDDGDPCTTNDVNDASCNCTGTFADADNDGVCDANDQCPGTDDALIGTSCDDGDPCTSGETYDSSCGCTGGSLVDSDNDGVCDLYDQCPGFDDALIGTTCDDGDPCTSGETYDNSCGCTGGVFQDADSDGVCDANDQCPGTDDAIIGTACDDGDDCTINDVYNNSCGCAGQPGVDTDNDGVCDANDQCPGFDDALIGTTCDDGDPCTSGETYDSSCGCSGGVFQDADSDGICDANDQCPGTDDALIGTSCDDGDACTTNDIYDSNCGCSGTFQDADSDGVCDANDQCPGTDDAIIGTSCDDGDDCTTNDVYDASCGCAGTFADSDGDGVCDNDDVCPGGDDTIDNNNNGTPDACEGCSYALIDFNDFNSGWGTWNNGGSDSRISTKDAPYANGGTGKCVRLRDNSSTSITTTDNLDLSEYEELTVNFNYYARSMDNSNEDFWLQVSTDGGSSFTTVEEWNRDDEFVNNQRYFESVVIAGSFSTTTQLRFRCDASNNSDFVYIDDVEITGCSTNSSSRLAQPSPTEGNETQIQNVEEEIEVSVYPNPVSDILNVSVGSDAEKEISIYDVTGFLVHKEHVSKTTASVNVTALSQGVYFATIHVGNQIISVRFIKL